MAVDSLHPSATIRYEKVSTNSLFTVTSTGSNAGTVSLSGTIDADSDPRTYTIVIRVRSIFFNSILDDFISKGTTYRLLIF